MLRTHKMLQPKLDSTRDVKLCLKFSCHAVVGKNVNKDHIQASCNQKSFRLEPRTFTTIKGDCSLIRGYRLNCHSNIQRHLAMGYSQQMTEAPLSSIQRWQASSCERFKVAV